MERQALTPLDESSRSHYIQRLEQGLEWLTNPLTCDTATWADHLADDLSFCSQMLCGVRPYQWDAMDRERT